MECTRRRRPKRRRPKRRPRSCRHRKSRRRHPQRGRRHAPPAHCGLRRLRTAPAASLRLASRSRKASLPPIRRSCRWERASASRERRLTTARTGSSTRALPYDNGAWTSTCRTAPKRGNSAVDPSASRSFHRGIDAPGRDAFPKLGVSVATGGTCGTLSTNDTICVTIQACSHSEVAA